MYGKENTTFYILGNLYNFSETTLVVGQHVRMDKGRLFKFQRHKRYNTINTGRFGLKSDKQQAPVSRKKLKSVIFN